MAGDEPVLTSSAVKSSSIEQRTADWHSAQEAAFKAAIAGALIGSLGALLGVMTDNVSTNIQGLEL